MVIVLLIIKDVVTFRIEFYISQVYAYTRHMLRYEQR